MILDCLIEVHDLLTGLEIPHGFGGAIALGNYADPRGTNDVDVNVATPFTEATAMLRELTKIGFDLDGSLEDALPAAGLRVVRGLDQVDLFFSFDTYHDRVLSRCRLATFTFGPTRRSIPVISPDDLVVFKMAFNRGKDWVDIESMLLAGTKLDLTLISQELVSLRGPTMHPRVARLRELIAKAAK